MLIAAVIIVLAILLALCAALLGAMMAYSDRVDELEGNEPKYGGYRDGMGKSK